MRSSLKENLPASSHLASIVPRASPSETSPQRLQAPTKPVRRITARQPLQLWQPDEAEEDGGHATSKFVRQKWRKHRRGGAGTHTVCHGCCHLWHICLLILYVLLHFLFPSHGCTQTSLYRPSFLSPFQFHLKISPYNSFSTSASLSLIISFFLFFCIRSSGLVFRRMKNLPITWRFHLLAEGGDRTVPSAIKAERTDASGRQCSLPCKKSSRFD